MARLSLVAFLALAFSGVAFAAPPASQEIVAAGDAHTTAGWSYSVCGMSFLVPRDPTCRTKRRHVGDPNDIVTIKSLNISPDPPKPGQQLTVTVDAFTSETIEVSGPGDCGVEHRLTAWLRKVPMPTSPSSLVWSSY